MAASLFDSPLFAQLFPTGDTGRLFTDSAELRAMLLVEGMLAKAQGEAGVIPELSAQAISRAAMEVQLDPGSLAQATGQNGVSVPGLVSAFREEMQAPEHAQYVHWGATSQDIIDTGLVLRLRQALSAIETDLVAISSSLAKLASAHAELPMPGRTYGQHATPTSFGAIVAGWGWPLFNLHAELDGLRRDCLIVSLSGAAGTSGALGPQAPQVRARLAELLNLNDPERNWHTDRSPILRLSNWMERLTLALSKIGEDATELVQTEIAEISLGDTGASSTMPQKQNPVSPSALVALARFCTGLTAGLDQSATHRHQRDGAAWFTEWLCLPQVVLCAASSAHVSRALTASINPRSDKMAAAMAAGLGMIHAEALSFALASRMARPQAQKETKKLCREAQETGTHLSAIVARDWPEIDADALFDPARQLAQAPDEALRFAEAVMNMPPA
ncbi:class-II fumarase/aspartase family protein [Primorskyibacter sp. S87]|uniref:class-II fumarase/aspartase family protein n=1 Tax=Primorskyibacter sp. S87 TaxID=3415126 RepID=UPI003C7AFD4E